MMSVKSLCVLPVWNKCSLIKNQAAKELAKSSAWEIFCFVVSTQLRDTLQGKYVFCSALLEAGAFNG